MEIVTTYKIIDEIRKQGYSKIICDDLQIPSKLLESKERLIEDWDNLPVDRYLENGQVFRVL